MEERFRDLVLKYVTGVSDRGELEEAIKCFEDPYHNLELRPTLYDIWNSDQIDQINVSVEDFSDVLSEIHHKINLETRAQKKSTYQKFILNTLKVAAVLVVGLLLGIFIDQVRHSEPVYFTAIAPRGSVSQTILPDGTLIYLNAGSEVKYEFDTKSKTRDVSISGEAWFDVKRNEDRPFIVHTNLYNVKVLGTKFNVSTYEDEENIVTTLEEGSIQVLGNKKFNLREEIVLKPGEQLIYNKSNNELHKVQVETNLYTSWKDNKLIFLEMSFADLVRLLERKYGVDIKVADKSLLEGHYSGTIKNESILEIMNIIQHTHPIRYEIEGQKIIIHKK